MRLYSSATLEEDPEWTGYTLSADSGSGALAKQLRQQIAAKDSEIASLREAQGRHHAQVKQLEQTETARRGELEAAQQEVCIRLLGLLGPNPQPQL